MSANTAKKILHSKWFPLVEAGTSVVLILLAVVMMLGRAPSYEQVPKTYTALVDDLRMRNTDKERYALYAKQAEKENNVFLQKLFTAAAEGQTLIIDKEYAMVNSLMERSMPSADSAEAWSTAENLDTSLNQEKYKADSVYPRFAQVAEEESYKEAKELFDTAKGASSNNYDLMSKAQAGDSHDKVFLCQCCGGLFVEQQNKCAICKSKELKEF